MPTPEDSTDQPDSESAPINLGDLVRDRGRDLGEIGIDEIDVVLEDIAPLPPTGSIAPTAGRLNVEQRHARQMYKLETAKQLAYGVLLIFGATIVFLLVWGAWAGAQKPGEATATVSAVMDFGRFILPFQVTALGVALGFYFAGRSEG